LKLNQAHWRHAAFGAVALGVVILIAGCQSAPTTPAGISILVYDQQIVFSGGYFQINRVFTDGPSWIVIYASENGAPGEIIGSTYINAGLWRDVRVYVDFKKQTSVLYAKLHTDAGKLKTFEYPGPDEPIVVDGNEVMTQFRNLSLDIQKHMN
jgi:hypothetical protein